LTSLSAKYEIGQNSNQVTFFNGLDPSQAAPIGVPIPALFYLFGRKCRIGLVLNGLPPQFTLEWHNLLFASATGVVAPGRLIKNLGNGNWQQVWLSSDDSLLLVISYGPGPDISGDIKNYTASIFDVITGDLLRSQMFDALTIFPRLMAERAHVPNIQPNMKQNAGQDPFGRDTSDPNNPSGTLIAAPIADVYSAVLSPALDRVTIIFRRFMQSGGDFGSNMPDTANDLANGTGNFQSVVLMLP
jgi:hypothetical protein